MHYKLTIALTLLVSLLKAQEIRLEDLKKVILSDYYPTAGYELLEENKFEFYTTFTDDPAITYYVYKHPSKELFISIQNMASRNLRVVDVRFTTKDKIQYEALVTQLKNECRNDGQEKKENGAEVIHVNKYSCGTIQGSAYKWMTDSGLKLTVSLLTISTNSD